MRHRAVIFSAGVVAGAVAMALWLMPMRRIATDRGLPAPGYLPVVARELLKKRMARHGDDLARLATQVALMDSDGTRALAEKIAAEPGFARPLTQDATELNAALPPAFFAAQDELRQRATALAQVAQQPDAEARPAAMTAALGALLQTCQRCHGVYLRGR